MNTTKNKKRKAQKPCGTCGSTDHRLDGLQISSYSVELATGVLTCWRCK